MAIEYDMCVDYDILCAIEDSLNKIAYDLENSTERMKAAIKDSEYFLAGNQFEKAKRTSNSCAELTESMSKNIIRAKKYIEELRSIMEEYGSCVYGENI